MSSHEDSVGCDWYAELYKEMTPRLIRFFYSKIPNLGCCQDLTQDVFMKHLRKFKDEIDSRSSISDKDLTYQRKWLYVVAKNHRTDEIKRLAVRDRHSNEAIVTPQKEGAKVVQDTTLEDPLVKEEEGACVRKVLASLSGKCGEALELMEVFEFSYPEIADALKLSVSSVGTTLSRCRKDFRESLRKLCPNLYVEQVR